MITNIIKDITEKAKERYDKLSEAEKTVLILHGVMLFFETPEPAKFIVALGLGKLIEYEIEKDKQNKGDSSTQV